MLVITTKSPYAVRALAELARRGQATPVPIGEIARAREIPVQFLEGLFATLRRAGILQSQRGVKGGYSFARPPSEVTILEIVELLEGELGAESPRRASSDSARTAYGDLLVITSTATDSTVCACALCDSTCGSRRCF